MKVLIVAKTFSKGGAATGASNLAAALESVGIDVVSIDADSKKNAWRNKFVRYAERIVERILFGHNCHCLKFGKPVLDLKMIVDEFQPNIVQLCDISGNLIGFDDVKKLSCPVVHRVSDCWPYNGAFHYGNAESGIGRLANYLMKFFIGKNFDFADQIVAPSCWLKNELLERALITVPVVLIRNAVLSPIRIDKVGKSVSPSTSLRFGFISNALFETRKGLKVLLEFLAKTFNKDDNIELILYGKCSYIEEMLFGKYSFNISYLGGFERDSKTEVYRSFDILLCPSKYDNSPNVVTEAFSMGIPVVGQINTGMTSYIKSGFNGNLIDYYCANQENVTRFKQQVRDICDNREAYRDNSINFVEDEMSLSAIGENYRRVYQRLLK